MDICNNGHLEIVFDEVTCGGCPMCGLLRERDEMRDALNVPVAIGKEPPLRFKINRFRDGALVLSCGEDGMESDLVFAQGAMEDGDPLLEKQREILEWIVGRVNNN